MIKLTFCGGVGEVTGANFLLEVESVKGKRKIVVDCGLAQGLREAREGNYKPFLFDPQEIDYLLITHAHIDHIGRVPKLVKEGFKGKIYSTIKTKELAPYMLEDSCRLLAHEAELEKREPLYNQSDVEKSLSLWHTIPYHTTEKVDDIIMVYMKNAGHILGSAIIEVTALGVTAAFTGDLGNTPTPLLPNTEYITDADYMVMESVYGDRNHPDLEHRRERLREALREGIHRGGTILIPMFSLEKTQVLLHELNHFIEREEIPRVPVYLDSPLALKVTSVYERSTEEFNDEAKAQIKKGDNIFDFPGLELVQGRDESSLLLHMPNPKIVIAGSGMSSGGRIVSHEKTLLPHENNTILFLGYQGVGTLGRKIQEGEKKVRIYNEDVKVKASIAVVEGYSSHKDSDNLLEFVSHTAPRVKKVFVAMGEPKSAQFLAQRIRDNFGIEAIHPQEGATFELN